VRGKHLAFILGLLAASLPGQGLAQEAPPTYLALRELKIALEQAIREAKRVSSDPPHFIIKKIELELQGDQTAGAQGSIGIPVFGVGVDLSAKGTYEAQQKLKIELVPPESQIVGGVPVIELAPLIRALKDTFRGGTSGGLVPSEIQFTYKWTLQLDGAGKISVVVAKAEVKVAQERSQQVTFHLCHTVNRSECTR
jgi:hypothetical protein